MRFGVTFSHPDLGNDPGFLKEYAQTVEGAGFDHLLAAEHVIGGHPDRLAGREGPHLRRRVPRAVRAVRLPRRGHPAPGAGDRASWCCRSARRCWWPSRPPSSTCSPAAGSASAWAWAGTGWSTRRSTRTSRTGARASRSRSRCSAASGRRSWSPTTGRWHHLDRMGLNPMPVQRPIPIWMGSFVGAVVEKVVRRIARLADGWFPQMPPGDELAAALDRLRGYAIEAGPRPGDAGHRVRHRGPARRRPATLGRPRAGLPGARCHPPPPHHGGWRLHQPPGAPGGRPAVDRGAGRPQVVMAARAAPASARRPAMAGRASNPTVIMRKPAAWRAGASEVLAWTPGTTPWRWHAATTVASALWKGSPGLSGAGRQAVGEREVGRPHVDGVDPGHREDVVEGLHRLARLDHRDAGHELVGRRGVPRAVADVGPERPEAPRAGGRVAARGHGPLGLLDRVHHRDDHAEGAGVEDPPDDALLVPGHPHDRHRRRAGHGVQHGDHVAEVGHAVLHVDADVVVPGRGGHLREERDRAARARRRGSCCRLATGC